MVHSVAEFSYETVCVYAPFEFCIVNTFLFVCQTQAGKKINETCIINMNLQQPAHNSTYFTQQ